MEKIKHSITYYGFGEKWRAGHYTFEDLFRISARLGGDGIEIVAPQMVPTYPFPSEAWITYFQGLCAEHHLTPVSYSVYVDTSKHTGRLLTEDERIETTITDMEYAKMLGFSVVRTNAMLTAATMEKLLPYAEELGIHLAPELHGPQKPSSPEWQEFIELFERKNSAYIGVVMDFTSFNSAPPANFLDIVPDWACNKQLLLKARDLFEYTEMPLDGICDFVRENGGTDADIEIMKIRLFRGFGPYDRTKVEWDGFRSLLKWSKYMHGKFYYVDENLETKGIDYPRIIKIMKEENYQGFMASEYEGAGWDPERNDEEQIARHIQMVDKLWAEV